LAKKWSIIKDIIFKYYNPYKAYHKLKIKSINDNIKFLKHSATIMTNKKAIDIDKYLYMTYDENRQRIYFVDTLFLQKQHINIDIIDSALKRVLRDADEYFKIGDYEEEDEDDDNYNKENLYIGHLNQYSRLNRAYLKRVRF
jgi:hypothetical protein